MAADHPGPRRTPCRPRPVQRSGLAERRTAAIPRRAPADQSALCVGVQVPWVAAQGISTHWLRHTTLTWVERHFGYGIARAYAGHTDSNGPSTTTYIKADLQAVAAALSAMTGQAHPLAAATAAG